MPLPPLPIRLAPDHGGAGSEATRELCNALGLRSVTGRAPLHEVLRMADFGPSPAARRAAATEAAVGRRPPGRPAVADRPAPLILTTAGAFVEMPLSWRSSSAG